MTEATTKFRFENAFDAVLDIEDHLPDEQPVLPTFSEQELEAAKQAAREEGYQSGMADAQASIEQATAETFERTVDSFAAFTPTYASVVEKAQQDVTEIAEAVIRKVVEATLLEGSLNTVIAVISDLLPKLLEEPRLVIRLHPENLDALQQQMNELKGQSGYSGDVILLAEADLAPSDCRIEWADGGAERETHNLWAEIDTALERYKSGINYPSSDPDTVEDVTTPEEISNG
ncbi:MAG: hypothetical protein GKS01_06345 [Alphaproteobacteria bacterium]|nr:hypothetical protein [Alphaproteobacteria bacterium]